VTSEELASALLFLKDAIDTLADPRVMARLKYLQAEANGTMHWVEQFNPVEGYERAPERGTCPTCGKLYTFKGDQGGIRRHGKGRCSLDNQMAAEIVPAVLLISQLGEVAENSGNDDGRTQ
jgi:hypothetical protein